MYFSFHLAETHLTNIMSMISDTAVQLTSLPYSLTGLTIFHCFVWFLYLSWLQLPSATIHWYFYSRRDCIHLHVDTLLDGNFSLLICIGGSISCFDGFCPNYLLVNFSIQDCLRQSLIVDCCSSNTSVCNNLANIYFSAKPLLH